MMTCQLCKREFRVITNTHLKAMHASTIKAYAKRFGAAGVGFALSLNQIPKNDPRHLHWKKSLANRPPPWSKGQTKETNKSVAKMAATFKKKKIDNFAQWREKAITQGLFKKQHPPLVQNAELAFLIGLVLGDGNIQAFPRTERLTIALGTDKPKLWKYAAVIVEKVFSKKPTVTKVTASECMRVSLYQKEISRRLQIPTGARGDIEINIPKWINENNTFLISYIKGLFEAEGSFCIHLPTCTYNFAFANKNKSLLNIVENSLRKLDFQPRRRPVNIALRKRAETLAFEKLISFRKYPTI